MIYLFLDNFRGFSRMLLTLKDTNFFVGENSTGKTSILALIKLLDSPRFWFDQRFNTDEVRLGSYKDIVSIDSSDKSYFRIGLVSIPAKGEKVRKGVDGSQAFLCTFEEEEGAPILAQYTTVVDGEQMHVLLSNRVIKYKSEGSYKLDNDRESVQNMMFSWADSHQQISKGYRSVRIPGERRDALAFLPSILEDILREKRREVTPRRFTLYARSPFERVVWLAPIRTKPQRTYDSYRLDFSPEGDHTPYLIKKYLMKRTKEQQEQAERFTKFIEKFGKDSGLFKTITVKDYDRRVTTSPFELDIVLRKEALSIDSVGYGVSQSLPVVVELFARRRNTWFTIQQPEIHLHPRAQLSLGEIIFELAVTENKKFIVETHSDFTIDGFRLKYSEKKIPRKPDAQIVFFERTESGNTLHEIEIFKNGEISEKQPKSYREFFVKEQMSLLGL